MINNGKIPETKYKKSASRPTIGFLTYGFGGDPCSYPLWSGIYTQSRKKGVNLICFPGNPPNSPIEFEAQANALYNLVNIDNFDGLLIWGSGLAILSDFDKLTALYQKYQSVPIVNISLAIAEIPNIGIDNYQGIYDLMVHLIKEHGCRRIVFIRGPENHFEAEERYRAYRKVLADYGLTFDPTLVLSGNFKQQSGFEAVNRLLDQPEIHFEAILAANDRMAIGAMESLRSRDIRIPEEVLVTGFDDIEESKYINPSLTTARQPFYEIGCQAVKMLLTLMAGHKIPKQILFSTRLMIRHSCGCLTSDLVQATKSHIVFSQKDNSTLKERRNLLIMEFMKATKSSIVKLKPKWAEQLFDTFSNDLQDNFANQFIPTLNRILHQTTLLDDDEMIFWHGILSALYRILLPCLNDDQTLNHAENLWQHAHLLIEEITKHAQAYQKLHIEHHVERLHQIIQKLGTSYTIKELIDKAMDELPKLGIPSCYLSLYEDQKAEWSRLMMAYNQQGPIELDSVSRYFASCQLVPDCLWPQDQCYTMVVEPLYFQEKQFGFALFEVGPLEGLIYEVLRGELSSVLYGVSLFQERRQAEQELMQSLEKIKGAMEGAIQAMAFAVEMRDPYTAGHQRRVAQLACAIAHELKLPLEQIEGIKLAAMIHDIGKLAIPAEILSKPTKLSATEFEFIKIHPQIGYDILKAIEFPWPIAQIVLQHHKRIDGSGYPPEIPVESLLLEAKILGVADVVEAMSSHRPYRPSLGLNKALEEISLNRDRLYDPAVVNACMNLLANGLADFNFNSYPLN